MEITSEILRNVSGEGDVIAVNQTVKSGRRVDRPRHDDDHERENAMKKRHHIPNLLSASRFVLCLPLCWAEALTFPFWMLYLLIGATDILDGFLARRWNATSTFGAKLDSWADLAFAIAVGYKLFPWLKALPVSLWIMIGIIALVKLVNVISSLVVLHKVVFLHTLANKITGVLVFIGLLAISQPYFIYAAWAIACVALFAAVQEGHWIRKGNFKERMGSIS